METRKTKALKINCEQEGLVQIRCLIAEFINEGKGNSKVREYLESVIDDNVLLLIYLKGRKYRVKHAWETLKRKAEIRFNDYPEVFPDEKPPQFFQLLRDGKIGLFKYRDNSGARIGFWNGENWDTDEYNLDDITMIGAHLLERVLFDEDIMNNGVSIIINCAGFGIKHGMQFTLRAILKLLHVFWYAYPVKIKGIYFINVPFYLEYLHKVARPFFPKKFKERFFFTTSDKQFKVLHENLSPKVLPKFLGGVHENEDCLDLSIVTDILQ